jgi:molecular chaperone GrpE
MDAKEATMTGKPTQAKTTEAKATPAKTPESKAIASPAAMSAPKAAKESIDYSKQIKELTDTLKRVQADFENHVKQSEKRSQQQCEQASARVLMKVLSIVDDFERALRTLEDAKIDPKLLEGMRMVNKNIHAVIEAEGVRPIDCLGRKLDPFKHEVLRKVKKDGVAEDVILEEHVKGYMLKDKVLRFAKVTVAHNG